MSTRGLYGAQLALVNPLLQAGITDAEDDGSVAGPQQIFGFGAHAWHCRRAVPEPLSFIAAVRPSLFAVTGSYHAIQPCSAHGIDIMDEYGRCGCRAPRDCSP